MKKKKKSPTEYYSYNDDYCPGKIIKLFRKANQNHKYNHAVTLLENHRDILCKQPYFNELINFQFVVMKCKRLNQFSWSKLSRYEKYMFCDIIDYALLKHIWERKLVSYWEVREMVEYINFKQKQSIVRYLHTVIQIQYHKLTCMNNYVKHLNEFDLYFLTHRVVKNIQNDLMDMSAIKYYIYSMMVSTADLNEYTPLLQRYTNNIAYDQLDKVPPVNYNTSAYTRPNRTDESLNRSFYHGLIYNIIALSPQDRLLQEYDRLISRRKLKIELFS